MYKVRFQGSFLFLSLLRYWIVFSSSLQIHSVCWQATKTHTKIFGQQKFDSSLVCRVDWTTVNQSQATQKTQITNFLLAQSILLWLALCLIRLDRRDRQDSTRNFATDQDTLVSLSPACQPTLRLCVDMQAQSKAGSKGAQFKTSTKKAKTETLPCTCIPTRFASLALLRLARRRRWKMSSEEITFIQTWPQFKDTYKHLAKSFLPNWKKSRKPNDLHAIKTRQYFPVFFHTVALAVSTTA